MCASYIHKPRTRILLVSAIGNVTPFFFRVPALWSFTLPFCFHEVNRFVSFVLLFALKKCSLASYAHGL